MREPKTWISVAIHQLADAALAPAEPLENREASLVGQRVEDRGELGAIMDRCGHSWIISMNLDMSR
jgi:hypothetical protein